METKSQFHQLSLETKSQLHQPSSTGKEVSSVSRKNIGGMDLCPSNEKRCAMISLTIVISVVPRRTDFFRVFSSSTGMVLMVVKHKMEENWLVIQKKVPKN